MHTTQPPMPRSQQLRNAAAAAANGVVLPPPPPLPQRSAPVATQVEQPTVPPMQPANFAAAAALKRHQSSIDYGKYKTKLCRNYILGVPCPFESRCVFAHGEDQLSHPGEFDAAVPASTTSAYSAANSMEFPAHGVPPAYYGSSSDDDAAPASPPTYESFLAAAGYMEPASPLGSDPTTPIAPVRYRHDPYTLEGIVYKFY